MSSTPLNSQTNFHFVPNSQANANQLISGSKRDLRTILGKLKQLQKSVVQLRSTKDNLPDHAWNNKISELKTQQEVISNILQKFKNKSRLETLKGALRKRGRKRRRICRRNIRAKKDREESERNRIELERRTDEWLKKEIDKSLERKRAEEASQKSNIVLYAVNKKISEAERYIRLFEKLEKLRKYRKIANLGRNRGESDFLMKVRRLKCVWQDALTEYETEKRKLQSLLSESAKPLDHQWKEVIFGEDFQNDSMNMEAKSLQEFIEIRRTWDSYLVPEDCSGGTSIPSGWVMPNEKPSELWSPYRCAEYDKDMQDKIS